MAAKKRKDISKEVAKLEAKSQDVSQKALDLAKFAEETKSTFDSQSRAFTADTSQTIRQANHELQTSIDTNYNEVFKKSQEVYDELEEKQEGFEKAIASDKSDLAKLNALEKEAKAVGTRDSNIVQAKKYKQEEINFLDVLTKDIEKEKEELKTRLVESRQRRQVARLNSKSKNFEHQSYDRGADEYSKESRGDSRTEFAKTIDYGIQYGSFEAFEPGDSCRIQATMSDGTEIGYINVKKQLDGRVYIQDILVADRYRGQGIGTRLLKTLEKKLHEGTVMYFTSNESPAFWGKKGFRQITNNDGKTEFCKKVPHKRQREVKYWTETRQCPPGLWYKLKERDGKRHILLSEQKENLAYYGYTGHDHYMKINGQWYVQVATTSNHYLAIDNKGHLFNRPLLNEDGQPIIDEKGEQVYEKNMEFSIILDYDMGTHLDRMWERLTGELTQEGLWPISDS